ncbi:MAG: HPr family phosphocarrier protein [Candidatus Dadabacteria bacterium]|nr:HPr family phosphocarrier protein [Candidatus Dadabacteria bacterium]
MDTRELHTKDNERSLNVFSEEFEIINKLGLHARAAVLFIKAANAFQSQITVVKDGVEVNGKSIMGILMLGATQGSAITVTAQGPDAKKAVMELGKLIASKFGEE